MTSDDLQLHSVSRMVGAVMGAPFLVLVGLALVH
jgi:hypothetical protein